MGSRTTIVRELHVYDPEVLVNMVDNFSFEHKGFEGKLLAEAKRIPVEEFNAMRILVQSGIGAGEYYRKKGYYNRMFCLLSRG